MAVVLKAVKLQILHGSIARRVFLRAFFIASALSIFSLVHILSGPYMLMFTFVNPGDCASELGLAHIADPADGNQLGKFNFQSRCLNPFWGSFDSELCRKEVNLTVSVVRELMGKYLQKFADKCKRKPY